MKHRFGRGRNTHKTYMRRGRLPLSAQKWLLRLKKHRFAVLIAGAAVVCVILLCAGVFTPNQVPAEDEIRAAYEDVDEETLQGLTDTALSEQEQNILQGERTQSDVLGVCALTAETQGDMLASLEERALLAQEEGRLSGIIIQDAQGQADQQVQDALKMIEKGVTLLIITDADAYHFQKIAYLAQKNDVTIIACNVQAEEGFAVNIVSRDDAAGMYAEAAKKSGAAAVYTVEASAEQQQAVAAVLPVVQNIPGEHASSDIEALLAAGTQINDLIVLDNSANSILKAYLRQGIYPHSVGTPAYVGFVKTWYALTHQGIQTDVTDENGNVIGQSPLVQAPAGSMTVTAQTRVANLGEVIFAFTEHFLAGERLSEENYQYTVSGAETITQDNLEQYYAAIGEKNDREILTSSVDTAAVDALFTAKNK